MSQNVSRPESAEAYARFNLVLMTTHACNMRCSYCYTGRKRDRAMPLPVGRKAIERATASLRSGGTLELGFFGGESMLQPGLVSALIGCARQRAARAGIKLWLGLTTNGTVADAEAWKVMILPELELAISCDGLPEVHDRHRRYADGAATSARVLKTMNMVSDAGKDFRVVMVVRPDTVESLPEGIEFLCEAGVRHVEPVLDLWAYWTREDAFRLDRALARCAEIWHAALPRLAVSWFDEKAALLAGIPLGPTARCAFGRGQVAVAPSGNLYPCERLIGADADPNPMRLAGSVWDGEDFLSLGGASGCLTKPKEACAECAECVVRPYCTATCPCSNYVRTGDVGRPDGLLCLLNRACMRETARVIETAGAEGHREVCQASPSESLPEEGGR